MEKSGTNDKCSHLNHNVEHFSPTPAFRRLSLFGPVLLYSFCSLSFSTYATAKVLLPVYAPTMGFPLASNALCSFTSCSILVRSLCTQQ